MDDNLQFDEENSMLRPVISESTPEEVAAIIVAEFDNDQINEVIDRLAAAYNGEEYVEK